MRCCEASPMTCIGHWVLGRGIRCVRRLERSVSSGVIRNITGLPPAAQLGILKVEKFTVPDGNEEIEAEVSAGIGWGAAILELLRSPSERILEIVRLCSANSAAFSIITKVMLTSAVFILMTSIEVVVSFSVVL